METTLNPDHCYQRLAARDSRFDGQFFVGVSTTGIYCRPICRVKLPRRERCNFYPSAAAAEVAGFRPCLRCRPELAPGHSSEDAVTRIAHRAAAKIRAGALAEQNLESFAQSLNISSRQLRRAIEREFGASPIALAQTCRLLTAKQLLTDSHLKIIDIAFASGFSSVRRFNDAFRKHYRMTPSELRKRQVGATEPGTMTFRLGYRPPLAWAVLCEFLHSRSAIGTSVLNKGTLSKTLRLGEVSGWFSARQDSRQHQLVITASADFAPRFAQLQASLRQYFDLDANPQIIDQHLASHRRLRKPLLAHPGLRLPGSLDAFEIATRAVIGQQVSVKAASTVFNRLVIAFGQAVPTPIEHLNAIAPNADTIAATRLQNLIDLGLNERRAQTIHNLAKGFADGSLHFAYGDDSEEVSRELQALPGIGPWTAQYVALRALGDPNAFPASDLALLKALNAKTPREAERAVENLQPWRAYAAIHLWLSLNAGG